MPDASRRHVIDDLFSQRAVSGTELITALLSDAVGLIRPPGNTRAAAVVAYDNQPKGIAILASTREGLEGRLPKTFPSREEKSVSTMAMVQMITSHSQTKAEDIN